MPAWDHHEIPCQYDPELWFSKNEADIQLAKGLCEKCPAKQACADLADNLPAYAGIWAGRTYKRGKPVPTKEYRERSWG